MTKTRRVYLLDPQKFSPEVIAVAFAKTSRSPYSFDEIANELTETQSAEFHEKWVVGYGHASVAEHAVLHIAIEGLSRLAVEVLESNRLASYTEKSTRYQKWGLQDFVLPPELEEHPLRADYLAGCKMLLETYLQTLPAVQQVIAHQKPKGENESDAAWERRIRSDYVDVCRFLLPAASQANVGMTINARALEHAILKMLSHPLAEVRRTGEEIKQAALQSVPTLIKYANANPYLMQVENIIVAQASRLGTSTPSTDWCRLVSFDAQCETHVLAAALFRYSGLSYAAAEELVNHADAGLREQMAYSLLGDLRRHDIPLRETEHAQYLFELTLDQGAYFELKRHRMMTQTAQPFTPGLGYAVPRALVDAGMEQAYHQAMQAAADLYQRLALTQPAAAAYILPNGFNRRVLLGFNLRSADHLVSLRSAPNAHFSMRRAAQRIAAEIRQATPLLGQYLRSCPDETWQSIEEAYFTEVAHG